MPPDWELGTINTGFLITISTTSGRAIGSSMLTISGAISTKYLNVITYGFVSFLFFILLVLVITNYGELRVKAIARIIKKGSSKKV
jgi:hypothetical protein